MSVAVVLANVWSFVLTLVRSLLALFARSPNPSRTTNDALRPILLTSRSISLSRTRSLAPHDAELGLPSGLATATATREGTPDTSHTGSSCVPLTPPDKCYLAPPPPATDCPYSEPWPTAVPLDRAKLRLSGSPLKVSTNTDPAFPEPIVAPVGSPPPGCWSPIQVWTSTPRKTDNLADPITLDHPEESSFVLTTVSHALVSRSQSSIQPYDDASLSESSPPVDDGVHHHTHALAPRSKVQPYPRFHHPDAYACRWRRHGARLPGKPDRTHHYAPSKSHADLTAVAWYDADVYVSSPVAALSPPLSDSATEDEDEMPLGRLKERLGSKGAGIGVGLALDLSSARASPRTRRMSEGCLLASTPTRVGIGARSGRQALSMALDGGVDDVKNWLDALSLRFSPEQKTAVSPVGVAAA